MTNNKRPTNADILAAAQQLENKAQLLKRIQNTKITFDNALEAGLPKTTDDIATTLIALWATYNN